MGHRRDIILMNSQELLLPEQEYTHQHGNMDGGEVHNEKLQSMLLREESISSSGMRFMMFPEPKWPVLTL